MPIYRIENLASGVVLGDYEGESEQDALDNLARDAGYEDHAEACEIAGKANLLVTELDIEEIEHCAYCGADGGAEAVSVLPRDDIPGGTLEVVVRMDGEAYACLVAPATSGQGYEPCGDCVERWLLPPRRLSREQVQEVSAEATLAAETWARAEGLL